MAMAIAGLNAASPVEIDDSSPIATSYPGFIDMAVMLGAEARWLNR
jgi:3-phosphoshikimate 1-carboxyvinyltransferase